MAEAILALRLRGLGDVVLTTPALRALKRGHAGARLEVVTEPRYVPLLEGLEAVDRVWPLERSSAATLWLVAKLRRRRFTLAVDFFGNPRSALVAAACGARSTAGYDLRGRRHAYRIRVPRDAPSAAGRREYAALAHLRLAEAVGGLGDGEPPRVSLTPRSQQEGERALAGCGVPPTGRAIGLVAGGTWPAKTWPTAHAAVLARRLLEAGHAVVLLAGPGEERTTAAIAALAPGVLTLPPCDVGALAGVIARLEAVVGTDSGPRHVAAALEVPTFSWFGPTDPDTWNPRGPIHGHWQTRLPCRACDRTTCAHWSCLPGLDPDHAAELVLAHLENHARPAAGVRPAARA